MGDPQELNGIADVLRPQNEKQDDRNHHGNQDSALSPLLIGTVKSNAGHSEPASGLVGLAKVVLAIQNKCLPANLHFKTPNPNITALSDGRFKVVTENTPWEGGIIGVNSFGFGGSNVHVILESSDIESFENDNRDPSSQALPLLIPFSGRTNGSIDWAFSQLQQRKMAAKNGSESLSSYTQLASLIYSVFKMDIPGHSYRGYALFDPQCQSQGQMLTSRSNLVIQKNPPLWLIFSGMGSQWPGMGRDLFKIPACAQSMAKTGEILQKSHGLNLTEVLLGKDETIAKTSYSVLDNFVGICAVQMALVDLLSSIGLSEDKIGGIIGHSVGEVACSYADGCLSRKQCILAAHARGEAILQSNLPPGSMAAIGLTWEEANEPQRLPPQVYPACWNSENSVTISGPTEILQQFVEKMAIEGIFAKMVDSSNVAFHSPHIFPASQKLKASLDKIIPSDGVKPRSEKWLSSSAAENGGSELKKWCSSEYHVNNLVSPVLFYPAICNIPESAVVLEVAPHSLLQTVFKKKGKLRIAKDALKSNSNSNLTYNYVGMMDKNESDNSLVILEALGKIFTAGVNGIDFSRIYGEKNKTFRLRASGQTPSISPMIKWDHQVSWAVPKFSDNKDVNNGATVFHISLENDKDKFYSGHKIGGKILFPATGYLYLVWKTIVSLTQKTAPQTTHVKSEAATDAEVQLPFISFKNVKFHRATLLVNFKPNLGNGDEENNSNPNGISDNRNNKKGKTTFKISISKSTGEFQVEESEALVVSGLVFAEPDPDGMDESLTKNFLIFPENPVQSNLIPLNKSDFYKELRLRGYGYTGIFQGVQSVQNLTDTNESLSESEHWGQIQWMDNWVSFLDTMLQFWIFSWTKSSLVPGRRDLYVPTSIQKLTINPEKFLRHLENLNPGPVKVPVVFDQNFNVVQSPGVEFCGLKANMMPKRASEEKSSSSTKLQLEEYKFVPYVDTETHHLTREEILRFCMDICVENTVFSSNNEVKVTEILLENPVATSVSALINQSLQSHPILEYQLTLMTLIENGSENSAEELKKAILSSGNEENLNSNPSPNFHLMIKSNAQELVPESPDQHLIVVQDPVLISKAVTGLQNGGFVLLLLEPENPDYEEYSSTKNAEELLKLIYVSIPDESFELFPIVRKMAAEEQTLFYLLRRINQSIQSQLHLSSNAEINDSGASQAIVIDLDKNSNQNDNVEIWLQQLKCAMISNCDLKSKRKIYLVSDLTPYSGILGLVNCIRKEDGGENIHCFFNMATNSNSKSFVSSTDSSFLTDFDPSSEILAFHVTRNLVMNVFQNGDPQTWGSYRHFPLKNNTKNKVTAFPLQNCQLIIQTPGYFSDLRWAKTQVQVEVDSHNPGNSPDPRVQVYYAALNFRDVTLASGLLSLEAIPKFQVFQEMPLGTEWAGLELSSPQSPTRRLMGIVDGNAFTTAPLLPDPEFTWEIPESWNLEEAASVPLAYITAYYALVVRGRLKSGSGQHRSILIHGGSGAVGQAAISICLSMNCTIFLTVGSENKRDLLLAKFPQLQLDNFANSRDSSYKFEKKIMTITKGRGVDVVLNSLAGEKLQASIRCLAEHGQFLEIGKLDLFQETSLNMNIFLKNISVHGILVDAIIHAHSDDDSSYQDKLEVVQLLKEGIRSGVVKPLETTVFSPEQAEHAFRFMASGQHIGKVIIKLREESKDCQEKQENQPLISNIKLRTFFPPSKTYIIIGGLGGFGLEMANWMVQRGAKHLVLASRSGVTTGYQEFRINCWRKQGVSISTPKVEESQLSTTDGALKFLQQVPPSQSGSVIIGGIFNLAMVLQDGLLENQTAEKFHRVCSPKVHVTIAMDEATRILQNESNILELDYFVVFSSVSCGRGNAGQSNYGFANSVMERVCESRRRDGLPGLAIQWGAIDDVGVVAQTRKNKVEEGDEEVLVGGTVPQKIESCLSVLDNFLIIHEEIGKKSSEAILSSIVLPLDRNNRGKNSSSSKFGRRLNLLEAIGNILGAGGIIQDAMANEVDITKQNITLAELGTDSITSLEIQNLLERESGAGKKWSSQSIRELTLAQIKALEQVNLE